MAVIITPEPGRHKEIGQLLLSLAGEPREVQWVTWPAAGFSVSEELFATFNNVQEGGGEDMEEPEALSAPRKRRGRPRREASTDNNDSEEG